MWKRYIPTIYPISKSITARNVVKRIKKFSIHEGCLPKSLNPLYRLADSVDYLNANFSDQCKEVQKMGSASSDLALFLKRAK